MASRDGLRATTASVALSSLVASVALGATAVVIARSLGPQGRGVFAASYSLLYLLIILGSLGVGPGGRRLLAIGPPDGVSLTEYGVAVWRLAVAQVVLAGLAAAFVLPMFDAGRSTGEKVAFVACSVTTLAWLLAREALFGVGGARNAEMVLALGSVATLLAMLVLALVGSMTVASALVLYAGVAFASFVWTMFLAGRRSDDSGGTRPSAFRGLVASGRPVLLLLVAQAVATRGDRLVIGAIAGSSELGYYAVAVSVMEMLSVGSLALANVAFQGIAAGTLSAEALTRALRITVAGTAAVAAIVVVAAPWLVDVVFGSRFSDTAPPLQVLAIAAIPYCVYVFDTQHLVASGRARAAATLAVAAATAMVVGDLLVVPSRGIVGAAWVSAAVFTASALLSRFTVKRHGSVVALRLNSERSQ